MGSPETGSGFRPWVVPPPSGALGRKSLEALPASEPHYSATLSLRFLCLDLHLHLPGPTSGPPPWPAGVGGGVAKQTSVTSTPTPASGPSLRRLLAPFLALALGLQTLGPSARPHSQEEAHLLSSEGRGRWPPPRSGLVTRAGTTRKRIALSSPPAETPSAAAPGRGSCRC